MNINELQQYKEWIGKSPVYIRKAVIDAGGWARVFPMSREFPEWGSRVRNFFNVTPVTLELLSSAKGGHQMSQIKNRIYYYEIWKRTPLQDQVKEVRALNGDVYVDENGRPWFEMDKLGAIYHIPGEMNLKKMKTVYYAKYSQMPVFKYISPDDTGGSLEVCVFNRNRASTFGRVGEVVQVSPWLIRNEVYRGSYNYAETVVRGIKEHEYRDVTPHKEKKGFYVNPPLYSSFADRRFPANDDDGKPLGYEGLEPYHFDNTRPDPPVNLTGTDILADAMDPRFPPNERVERLKQLFLKNSKPMKLLARIQARKGNDKAVNDFHKLPADTKSRLLQILKERAPV